MPNRIHHSLSESRCSTSQTSSKPRLIIISTEGRNLSRLELDRKDLSLRSRSHVVATGHYKKPETGSLIVLRLDCSLAPLLSHRSSAQRTMKAFRSAAWFPPATPRVKLFLPRRLS